MPKKPPKRRPSPTAELAAGPWIPMRSGLVIISITSIGMALLTTVQAWDNKSPLESILWGLAFGAMIWAIFGGILLFNRWIGRS
ncbi:MAG: hypothetical protein WCF84_03920 [Anaerolineae bacterium]